LLIPEFYDWGIAGQFSRGFNLLFVPLSLIAMAVAQVFFVRAVEAHRAGTLSVLSVNVHSRLVLLTLFPTAMVMVAGPDIFEVLFGEDWRPSAEYLRYVAPWIMFSIVASPMTRLFDVLERQRLELVVASLMFVAILGAILLGARIGGIEAFLLYLGIAGTLARFGQILLLLRLSGAKMRAVLSPYWKYFLPALPMLVAAAFVTRFDNPLMTLLTAVTGGAIFALYVVRSEKLI
jgi:O-antigen/teichoic acid export membrane protein